LTGTDIGISYLLPRLIGVSRAFDLMFSGRDIDATEAERMGLVSQVVADEDLLDHTLDYARMIASYTHIGLAMTKEVVWHNIDNPSMAAAIAIENRNQTIAGRSTEVQEYMRAYRKRTTGATDSVGG
jgi:enoyl-CoA hydratase